MATTLIQRARAFLDAYNPGDAPWSDAEAERWFRHDGGVQRGLKAAHQVELPEPQAYVVGEVPKDYVVPKGYIVPEDRPTAAMPAKHDAVDHPAHYTGHPSGVECITITEHMGFNLGNAVKYLWREGEKNGVEDLCKAVWYINREIEKRERESK